MESWRSGSFFRYFGVLLFVFIFLYTIHGALRYLVFRWPHLFRKAFGTRKKSADVFLAGLSKLCEDIGDVFLGIDLVQPRRPYDRHEDPGGLGSLL